MTTSMVRVSVTIDAAPDNTSEVVRRFNESFYPAICTQSGFLECVLLRETHRRNSDDLQHLRMDISFRSEQERLNWVETELHDDVFALLVQDAVNYEALHLSSVAEPPGTGDER